MRKVGGSSLRQIFSRDEPEIFSSLVGIEQLISAKRRQPAWMSQWLSGRATGHWVGALSPFPLHLPGMLCLLDGLPSWGGIGGVSGRGEGRSQFFAAES
jgi:hypothetical protein